MLWIVWLSLGTYSEDDLGVVGKESAAIHMLASMVWCR